MDWFDVIKQTRVQNIEGLIRELYKVTANPNAHQDIKGQLTEDKLNAAIAAAKQKNTGALKPFDTQQAIQQARNPPQQTQQPQQQQQPQPQPQQPKPRQRTQLQGYNPATASQKKTLSGRVKAALQRRKANAPQRQAEKLRRKQKRAGWTDAGIQSKKDFATRQAEINRRRKQQIEQLKRDGQIREAQKIQQEMYNQ